MSVHPQAVREDLAVKSHGDKLAAATGGRSLPEEPLPIAPSEPPLKRQGDKLSQAVERAAGGATP
jgi:hypothetical protein